MKQIRIATFDASGDMQQVRHWPDGVEFEYSAGLLFAASPDGFGCTMIGVPTGGRLEISAE